jgi:hypothetical protein
MDGPNPYVTCYGPELGFGSLKSIFTNSHSLNRTSHLAKPCYYEFGALSFLDAQKQSQNRGV